MEPIVIMSVDSKMFVRGNFKACIGVAISFERPEEFKERYIQFFEDLKTEYSLDDPRYVFKSYDLKRLFYRDYNVIVENFVENVLNRDTYVNFVFSSFNTQKLPSVQYYVGYRRIPVKTRKTLDFLDDLGNYYPYIAAWKVIKEAELKAVAIHLDNFEGENTKSWADLNKHNNVIVFPKGDQINPYISTADLLVNYIDNKMRENNTKLDMKEVSELLRLIGIERSSVFYCGITDINYLVPISDKKIPSSFDNVKPLIYIVHEEMIKKETKWIEDAPIYQLILWFASENNSGIKFISFEKDYSNIRNGDCIIYLGEEGRKKSEYLARNLGYAVDVLGLKDIKEKIGNR